MQAEKEMKHRKRLDIVYYPIIFFLIIVGDQFLKWIVLNKLPSGGIFVFKNIFGLILYQNKGIAFGIKIPTLILYPLILLACILIFLKFRSEFPSRSWLVLISFSLILSGGVSNILDRLLYGYVIDYFYLYPLSRFNLADLAIILGTALLIWKEFRKDKIKRYP